MKFSKSLMIQKLFEQGVNYYSEIKKYNKEPIDWASEIDGLEVEFEGKETSICKGMIVKNEWCI